MTNTDDTPLAADRSGLAEQLHEAGCLNAGCPGRAEHEREAGVSYLAVVHSNLAAGWTPPVPADGSAVPVPGGAVVVSVKPAPGLGGVEPKVWWASGWALLAPFLAAVAVWVVENPSALNALQLPAWARFGVLTLAGALGALLGGYRARSAVSERVRVTPVGNAAETTAVIPLGPKPVSASLAEETGEHYFASYRHTVVDPSRPDWTG